MENMGLIFTVLEEPMQNCWITRFLLNLAVGKWSRMMLWCQTDVLLLLQYCLNSPEVNISQLIIEFPHNFFNPRIIPSWYIPIKLVILSQTHNFPFIFLQPVPPFEIFLIIGYILQLPEFRCNLSHSILKDIVNEKWQSRWKFVGVFIWERESDHLRELLWLHCSVISIIRSIL